MEAITDQVIKQAKQYDKERSKKYYQANKDKIREKYQSLPPEQKHERSEAARKKRYILKHGSLEGFTPRTFGQPRVYKSGYYLEHKDKIRGQYFSNAKIRKSKSNPDESKSDYFINSYKFILTAILFR